MGRLDYGTDAAEVRRLAKQVGAIRDRGVEVAIVVGAGNIYRGLDGASQGVDRATGDYMGMLATVLNALTLQDALEAIERGLRVMDSTALSLCMDNDLPIYVFNVGDESNIDRIVSGEKVGTLVSSEPAE